MKTNLTLIWLQVKLRREKNQIRKVYSLKKNWEEKKGKEYILEYEKEEKELRRGEKRRERNGYWCFLQMGKKKGASSIVKLGILNFLLGRFTNG